MYVLQNVGAMIPYLREQPNTPLKWRASVDCNAMTPALWQHTGLRFINPRFVQLSPRSDRNAYHITDSLWVGGDETFFFINLQNINFSFVLLHDQIYLSTVPHAFIRPGLINCLYPLCPCDIVNNKLVKMFSHNKWHWHDDIRRRADRFYNGYITHMQMCMVQES